MFGSNHNVSMESTASEMSVLSTETISPPQSPAASLDSMSSLSIETVQSNDGNSMLIQSIPHNDLLVFFLGSSADSQVIISCKDNSPTPDDNVVSESEWTGFKIGGDNIDKTVKPRHVRVDRQTSSFHYFHSYAVKDRVNLANQSDSVPDPPTAPDLLSLLPNNDDTSEMTHFF